MFKKNEFYNLPDDNGFFGEFGGQFVDDDFKKVLNNLNIEFEKAIKDNCFIDELEESLKTYTSRPTPLYFAKNLTDYYGNRGKIYLKREDLNHTGAHKINNVLGQVLLAKRMKKKYIIAETGAGQHGVATATAAALFKMNCKIFMGEIDIQRQKTNVEKMKLLGAEVIEVKEGNRTLKDACDKAINYFVKNSDKVFYVLGSAVGPHPYPKIVRFFQSVIGNEIMQQCFDIANRLPDYILASIGGGSNAIGAFYPFIGNKKTKLIGLEAGGKGVDTNLTAASLTLGKKMILHGKMQYVLCDNNNQPKESYSISAGLDYPGCGPEHCFLKDEKLAEYYPVTDDEAVDAFFRLTKLEGIIPAIESAHALAFLEKLMKKTETSDIIVVNLSGRGDKDIDRILEYKNNKRCNNS